MVGLNKKDIKDAGFLFGPYNARTSTSTTVAAGAGQNNVWEHLGIPLSFDESLSTDTIERRTMDSENSKQITNINTNMVSVSFSFNIPKIVGTSTITGFDLTRWLQGEATKTNYNYGEDGATFTNPSEGRNFSLRFTDNENTPKTIILRNGKLVSVNISFDDGVYNVSCSAMFINKRPKCRDFIHRTITTCSYWRHNKCCRS